MLASAFTLARLYGCAAAHAALLGADKRGQAAWLARRSSVRATSLIIPIVTEFDSMILVGFVIAPNNP